MFTVGTQMKTMMFDGHTTHTKKDGCYGIYKKFLCGYKTLAATVSLAAFKVIHGIRSTTRYFFNQRHTISSYDSKHTQNHAVDLKCKITIQQANGFNASKNRL
jgi:hypothetical protein